MPAIPAVIREYELKFSSLRTETNLGYIWPATIELKMVSPSGQIVTLYQPQFTVNFSWSYVHTQSYAPWYNDVRYPIIINASEYQTWRPYSIKFQCYSSKALAYNATNMAYIVALYPYKFVYAQAAFVDTLFFEGSRIREHIFVPEVSLRFY